MPPSTHDRSTRPARGSRRWLILCLLAVASVQACSGSGTEPQAPVATAISMVSGGNQIGLVGTALTEPLVVKVTDRSGAPMPGVAVTFSVTGGGGSVSPATATSDASGLARSTRTLGPSEGAQGAQASFTGLSGAPVSFSHTAVVLTLSSIAPDTLIEGANATILGTGFDVTGGNYVVTVDGTVATIKSRSATQLTIAVPSSDCRPLRTAGVRVDVSGATSNVLSHPARPARYVDLAVGEMLLIEDPAAFCLQFQPAPAESGDFLVGMGAAAETPDALLQVSMTGVTGQAASVQQQSLNAAWTRSQSWSSGRIQDRFVPNEGVVRGGLVTPAPPQAGPPPVSKKLRGLVDLEQRVRQWERDHLDLLRHPTARSAASASGQRLTGTLPGIKNIGDTLVFHVPDMKNTGGTGNTQGLCAAIPITTVVKAVGNAGIFVVDINNPATDALTDAEIQALSDTLDTFVYPTDTLYFGAPTDLDENDRVVVLFSIEVNKLLGSDARGPATGGAFVSLVDFFDPALCTASDFGELFYVTVPDPGNAAQTSALPKAEALDFLSAIIAHEFTHVIQVGRRLAAPGSVLLSAWEMEGQATFAMETFLHAVQGNAPGQDYGAGAAGPYRVIFEILASYYGLGSTGDRIAGAPEECTLYGGSSGGSAPSVCVPLAAYGASWSLFRYVADRFGPAWPGGETRLMRDWIGANPSRAGVANIEALLGVSFDSLFARWAAMQYVDGRVAAADPALQMSSWDLEDVVAALGPNASLLPVSREFTDFASAGSIRGGSTAYSLFSGAQPRPATAIRVRSEGGAVLPAGLRPQLWVVRVR